MLGRTALGGLGLLLVIAFAGCNQSTSPHDERDGAVDGPRSDRPFPGGETGDTPGTGGGSGTGGVGGVGGGNGTDAGLGGIDAVSLTGGATTSDAGPLDVPARFDSSPDVPVQRDASEAADVALEAKDVAVPSPDAPPDGSPQRDGSEIAEVAPDATDAPSQSDRNAACGVPGTVVRPANLSGFLSYLLGSWAYCTGYHVFAKPYDGIEFVADGTWYFLHSDGKGGFVRGAGFDGGGTWSVLENNNFQLNVDLFGGGGDALFAAFQVNPMAMRAMNSMGSVGDYVKVSTPFSVDGGGDAEPDGSP